MKHATYPRFKIQRSIAVTDLNLYLKQKGYMGSQKNPGMETSFHITKKPNYKLYV